ncbi:MAG: D-alanine--D-alanine ligase, partial [Aquaticitalea sp.]
MKSFFHKISHWEYWPLQLVYAPIILLWPYFAIKARSLFFFSAANPKMKNGGFLMISKQKIYDLIPKQYYPKTLLIHPKESLKSIKEKLAESHLTYPLFLKPDIGLRGMAVRKIYSEDELESYH